MKLKPNISQRIKPGLIITCLSILILFCGALWLPAAENTAHSEHGHEAAHTEQGGGHEAHSEHGGGHDEPQSGHGGGQDEAHGAGHHAPPPKIYYFNWGLLGFVFFIALIYRLNVYRRGKPHHEGLALAGFLVFLVIVLYTADQSPEVLRHFDMATKQFVDGYHEAPEIGFIKFIYKMSLGVLLMMYGLLGMEHH